jgi:hypothetical protein
VVLGEAHLRRMLNSYARYYNESRIHRSLSKDARSLARLSASESSHRDLCSVVFIINIAESDFWYTQAHATRSTKTPPLHHAARRRDRVAACGARAAAGDAGDRISCDSVSVIAESHFLSPLTPFRGFVR